MVLIFAYTEEQWILCDLLVVCQPASSGSSNGGSIKLSAEHKERIAREHDEQLAHEQSRPHYSKQNSSFFAPISGLQRPSRKRRRLLANEFDFPFKQQHTCCLLILCKLSLSSLSCLGPFLLRGSAQLGETTLPSYLILLLLVVVVVV